MELRRARRGVVIAAMLCAPAARADDDAFAVMREADRAWTLERVRGPSLAQLTPVADAPQVRCQVAQASEARARIECAAGDTAVERFTLVFGPREVRELRDDDPGQLAARGNAGAFTFPRALHGGWRYEGAQPDGALAQVRVHDEQAGGATIWIAESTYRPARHGAAAGEPIRAVAGFAPGVGLALRCTVAGKPAVYSCLRLIRAPVAQVTKPKPTPVVSITAKQAQDKSSLSAASVATKISTAYLPAVRRCYAELLRKKPAAGGALQLDFVVNAVGKLTDARTQTADDTLAGCVRGAMDGWRFPIPQSEYGEPRNARFVITLKLALSDSGAR